MRDVLLHHHVFKNAGSTIDWALERSFGPAFMDHRDDRTIRLNGMRYVDDFLIANDGISALSSHHMPFDPAYISDTLTFWHIFMLREPISRALSVYRFEKTQADSNTPGSKMAKQLEMREYFMWRMGYDSKPVLRNFHTRWLSGMIESEREVDEEDFKIALDWSRMDRVFIGFVERFDESMTLFENELQSPFKRLDLGHVIQNRGGASPSDPIAVLREEVGTDIYEEFRACNALDLRLYETLSSEFATRIGANSEFGARLQRYRTYCASLCERNPIS